MPRHHGNELFGTRLQWIDKGREVGSLVPETMVEKIIHSDIVFAVEIVLLFVLFLHCVCFGRDRQEEREGERERE